MAKKIPNSLTYVFCREGNNKNAFFSRLEGNVFLLTAHEHMHSANPALQATHTSYQSRISEVGAPLAELQQQDPKSWLLPAMPAALHHPFHHHSFFNPFYSQPFPSCKPSSALCSSPLSGRNNRTLRDHVCWKLLEAVLLRGPGSFLPHFPTPSAGTEEVAQCTRGSLESSLMENTKTQAPQKGTGYRTAVSHSKVTAYARATGEQSDGISGHHLKTLL